jgi:hypothetical protein
VDAGIGAGRPRHRHLGHQRGEERRQLGGGDGEPRVFLDAGEERGERLAAGAIEEAGGSPPVVGRGGESIREPCGNPVAMTGVS